MTNITIRNESGGRYLTAPLRKDASGFEMLMIDSVTGKNILKPGTAVEDGIPCLSYNITDCWSFQDFFHGKELSGDDIRSVVIQLNDAARTLTEHLLSEENLMLSPECVFADKTDGSLKFCVFPDADPDFAKKLNSFFGALLNMADLKDTEGIRLCARLCRESSSKTCRMYDIMNALILDRHDPRPCRQCSADEKIKLSSGIYDDDPLVSPKHSPVSGFTLSDPDDMDTDITATDEEDGSVDTSGRTLVTRFIIPQIIILAGVGIIYITRGMTVVRQIVPLYIILSLCLAAYTIVNFILEKKRETGAGDIMTGS